MKKSLLLIFFLSVLSFSVLAQNQYKISFTGVTVDKSLLPNYHDTAYYNETLPLNVFVHNDGTVTGVGSQDFPGGTFNLQYYIGKDFAKRKVMFSKSAYIPPLKLNDFTAFTNSLLISKAYFAKADTTYIVIIWPSGLKLKSGDSLDSSKYTILSFYLSSKHNTGINNSNHSENWSIYPNPARENVNIQMLKESKGSIKLTDISGKIVAVKPFDAREGEIISLPLNEGSGLSTGIYFIAIETATSLEVSKILISK